jgi:hypothetical protein
MTDQAPSPAVLAAVRRLDEYGPDSAAQARTVVLRLWPRIDADQLSLILDIWKDSRRPVAPTPSDVITLSSVAPIGAGRIRAETETE